MTNFFKYRLPLYAVLALALFLGMQWAWLYIRDVGQSTTPSIYRVPAATRPAKPLKPPEGSQPLTQPVRGFKSPPSASNPTPQFTIGTWEVDCPGSRDVTISVTSNEQGVPQATYTIQPAGILEVGQLREAGFYLEKGWNLSKDLADSMEIGLYYEQDLFRTGPLWWRGGARAGYEQADLPTGERVSGVKVAINAKVAVRF